MKSEVKPMSSSTRLSDEVKKRRTFAIISHPDAGKTTLTEKLLWLSGAIQSAGSVKAKKNTKFATADWMAIEKQRGISVASSVMQFTYREHIINLLDTPGHQDFSEDTYRVLTAVDAALMVIDAAKGVEAQTIKLLEVCRLRHTPIITFINKLDREVRDPLDLLDEIEAVLAIQCAPITWPIGMGKCFRGLYHRITETASIFAHQHTAEPLAHYAGIANPELDRCFPLEIEAARQALNLLDGASAPFALEAFLAGQQTPVFFGSAIHHFGVLEVLNALIDWAPAPTPRATSTRQVIPDEPRCSGFVFKIQANMDAKHRDRMAFMRICSGRFHRGKKLKHLRLGRDIAAHTIVTFMASEREQVDEAFAGDIIGLPNHGTIQIGDSFSEGEALAFIGIPYFAPELFCTIGIDNPLKSKQLYKGLQQLGEEGAVQVFRPLVGTEMILGAVGSLQFDVVKSRLQHEYGVLAILRPCAIATVRWVSCADAQRLAEFEKSLSAQLARDAANNLSYLATNRINLALTQERWPDIEFHCTREHALTF